MDTRHTSQVHISLLYMQAWFLHSYHMDPGSCYTYYCSMLPYSCYTIVSCYWYGYSRYWTWELLICAMWESHISCSRFPLYGSMLSTELRSSYHVTRIMYCIYSCYLVYLTYQIRKITWVWGRLDGWLDHIGWMSGSIVRPTAGDGVVLATVCYSCYMLQL